MSRAFSWMIGAAVAGLAVPAGAAAVHYGLLDTAKPGRWSLHQPGESDGRRSMCVPQGRALAYVAHRSNGCRVVHARARRPQEIELSYICPGVQGMSRIRLESDRLVHIETQGIAGGAPFHESLEARWSGACG